MGATHLWDPVTSSAGWDDHVLGLVYATITTVLPSGDVGPGLASSWNSPRAQPHLHSAPPPDFSDGTPLDAAGGGGERRAGPDQSNSTMASELSVISKVVVNSPTSFTLDLQVNYQVPYLLSAKTA